VALASVGAGSPLRAESALWSEAHTLDCPVAVSTADQELSRTVVFPCQAIASYLSPAQAGELTIHREGHALILRLAAATFEATVPVWDEAGRLYTLRVRAPGDGEAPDDTLIVHDAEQGRRSDAPTGSDLPSPQLRGPRGRDTDQAVIDLMAEMAVGRPASATHASRVTTWIRGVEHPGRTVVLDDTFSLTICSVYQTESLFGYVCSMEWQGDQPLSIAIQRLWRPGYLAVCPGQQEQLGVSAPQLTIPPHGAALVLYVTDGQRRTAPTPACDGHGVVPLREPRP
jgi:hypothetical protein